MYSQQVFQMDRAACLALAATRGFGTVIASGARGPVASPLPFCIDYACDGAPLVNFHVARGNPLAALAGGERAWLIAVQGHDAYVSPDWYASPGQVPTWLYESVQLSGPVRAVPPDEKARHLDRVSETFESWLAPKPPWTPDRIAPGRREAMMSAIVALEMAVEAVDGSCKLNQQKSDADHIAVVVQLRRRNDPMSTHLVARMVALRPQLDYE
jgi:transcriptional regulator